MRPYRLLLALLAIAMALPSHLALARPVAIVGNLRAGTVTVVDEQALKTLGTIDVTPDGKTPRDPAQAAIYPVIVKSKGVNYVQGLALDVVNALNGKILHTVRLPVRGPASASRRLSTRTRPPTTGSRCRETGARSATPGRCRTTSRWSVAARCGHARSSRLETNPPTQRRARTESSASSPTAARVAAATRCR